MKLLSLLVLGFLALPCVGLADVVVLKDGTTVEGEIRRTGDGYIVKGAGGAVTNVATDKVERIEVRPSGGADAATARLQSLRRASENMADIKQILDRYRTSSIKTRAALPEHWPIKLQKYGRIGSTTAW